METEDNKKEKLSWRDFFTFTKEGRVKNLDLMYGFFLAIGQMFVNFFIGNRLTLLFEKVLTGWSRPMKNAADTLVPMLLCMAVTALLFLVIRKKNIVLIAQWIGLIIAAVLLIVMLFLYDKETLSLVFLPFVCMFGVPAAADAALATVLYLRRR